MVVDPPSFASRQADVDGALHAIGFAPEVCLGDDFMAATWDDVKVAVEISAYSLKLLADAMAPLMTDGGSIVGLDFDAFARCHEDRFESTDGPLRRVVRKVVDQYLDCGQLENGFARVRCPKCRVLAGQLSHSSASLRSSRWIRGDPAQGFTGSLGG